MTLPTRRLLPALLLGLAAAGMPIMAPANAADDGLREVARDNDLSVAKVQKILKDPTARVGVDNRIYYVEPVASGSDRTAATPSAAFPLDQTFTLHSKPGSNRTIFLDFDGTTVSGTAWNAGPPLGSSLRSGFYGGWDPANDGSAFNDSEKAMVQDIFLRVAEDYAPFDVDITTQDPGDAALTRNNGTDQTYGARALISGSDAAFNSICNRSCGGVAYIGTFDIPGDNSYYQPAWIFPDGLSNDPKNIAEATSHEVGHNLGLDHDGRFGDAYYDGHNGWAPIMGVGYSNPITQWSKGEYSLSTTTEDDLAIINSHGLANRADEAGGNIGTAASGLPVGTAYVASRTDIDVYALGQCTGPVSFTATPAAVSPNLDIKLSLLNAAGASILDVDLPSAKIDRDRASNLGATLNSTLSTGIYYLAVDGVGRGGVSNGYSDYGSLGAYTLTGTNCASIEAPGVPKGLSAVRDIANGEVDVSWTAPADDGGSAISRYDVLIDDVVATSPTGTRATVSLDNAAHTVAVRATNAAGTGSAATVPVAAVFVPAAPATAAATRTETNATITWTPPATDGGAAVTGYEVSLDDGPWVSAGGSATRDYTFSGISLDSHTLAVRAANAVGPGTPASIPVDAIKVPAPPTVDPPVATKPGAPQIGRAKSGRRGGKSTAKIQWQPPATDGGATITKYQIFALKVKGKRTVKRFKKSAPANKRGLVVKLPRGTYRFMVRAVNAEGKSRFSKRSNKAKAR